MRALRESASPHQADIGPPWIARLGANKPEKWSADYAGIVARLQRFSSAESSENAPLEEQATKSIHVSVVPQGFQFTTQTVNFVRRAFHGVVVGKRIADKHASEKERRADDHENNS